VSYRHGLREEVDDLVDRIEVRSNGTLVRTYDLQYDHDSAPPTNCDAPDRALLCAVSVDAQPTQTFEYAPAAFGLGEEVDSQIAPAPPSDPNQHFQQLRSATASAETKTSTMDMNGDGLLDYVNASDQNPGTWEVWFGNKDGSGFNVYRTWAIPGGVDDNHMRAVSGSGSPATRKETMDLTGDGIADFVDASPTTYSETGNKWKVYAGYCSDTDPFACGFSGSPVLWPAPEAELGEELLEGGGATSTIKRLVDMNGDGRPDLVKSAEKDQNGNWQYIIWKVWLNNGTGFASSHAADMRFGEGIFGGHITRSVSSAGTTRTERDTFDFNGDGLPDHVTTIWVYLNDGLAFDSAGKLIQINPLRSVDNGSGETTRDFLDVNADGLPDLVQWVAASNSWSVRLNQGTSLAAAAPFPGASGTIRRNNSRGNTKWDVLDWNGDGFIDRVDANGDTWTVQLGLPSTGPGIRPYLMTRSKNGMGGLSDTRYAPSTRYTNTRLPFTSWVVTGTRRTDGLCGLSVTDAFTLIGNPCLAQGHEVVTTLEYEKGYFDGVEREFRGFGKVTERYPAEPDRSRVVEFNQATHTRGQMESEEIWAAPGSLASREDYSWTTYVPDVNVDRTQVYMSQQVTDVFDLDTPSTAKQCSMKRNERPDSYGRVTRSCALSCGTWPQVGCVGAGLPAGLVVTETAWATIANSGVRERPATVTTKYKPAPGTNPQTLALKHYLYDGSGNVTSVRTEGLGSADATVTNEYDEPGSSKPARGNITKVIEPEQQGTGIGTTSTFAAATSFLFPTTETTPLGLTTTKLWDLRHGKESQVTGPNGEVSVATYDAAGRTLCEAKPGSSCSSGIPTAQYLYVCAGSASCGSSSSASGFEGKLSYVEVRTRETGTGNTNGYLRTRSFVDALGRERATAQERVIGEGNTLEWVVTEQTEYDALGRKVKVYAPYEANAASDPVVGLAEDPTLLSVLSTRYAYDISGVPDPLDRVRKVTTPDNFFVTTEYAGAWTHSFDQEGNKTSSQKDAFGREIKREVYEDDEDLKLEYAFTYDGLDHVLTSKVGSGSSAVTVSYSYDGLGRQKSLDDPDSGLWWVEYDRNGNPIYQDDPKPGQHVQSCFDAMNRVTLQCSFAHDDQVSQGTMCSSGCEAAGGTTLASFFYDQNETNETLGCGGAGGKGQLTRVVDSAGLGEECLHYDTRGRLRTSKKTIDAKTAITRFNYDDADHLTSIVYPDEVEVDNGYQADGLPDTVEQIVNGAEYDAFGRSTKIIRANGTRDEFFFDTAGTNNFRLQTIETTKAGTTTAYYLDVDYSYYPRGKLKRITDNRDAGTARSNAVLYDYDGAGRLTCVDRDPASPTVCTADESFVHNSLGNIESKNSTNFGFVSGKPHQVSSWGPWTSMTYDANGSRRTKTQSDGSGKESIYDARGLMVQAKALGSGGSVTGTQTNTYDHTRRRVMVTSPSGTKTRYFNRYADSSSADGNLTKYFFLGDRLVASWVKSYPTLTDAPVSTYRPESWEAPPMVLWPLAGGVLLLLLIPGGRRRFTSASLPRVASIAVVLVASSTPVVFLAACSNPPTVRHYHLDRLGTTQVVTDYGGNIYRQMRYYAYGEVRARFNGAGNPVSGVATDARYEFTGYETDAFSGLDYAGARFYDPELGQFQSHDPQRQFASPYAYGPGDPINGNDPTGEDFGISLLIIAAIAAVAAFIDSYIQTGDWGLALASAGMAFVGTFVGAGVGWVINAGLKAINNVVVTVAVRTAQVGYAAYGTADGLANGRPFSAGVAIGQLAYGLAQGNGEAGKSASGDSPKQANSESEQWMGEGVPDSDVVEPGQTRAIADQNHGNRFIIEAATPTTIPDNPAPVIELDMRLTFVPDHNLQPGGTLQTVTAELPRELPAKAGEVFELFNRRVEPVVGDRLARPYVQLTNTGNVPVAVRVRSVMELHAAR
jgi:RHS repeat-associated protein